MKVRDVYEYIDSIAPFSTQDSFDNAGMLVGDSDAEVKKIAIALDITNEVVEEAHRMGADLIVSHHPVIFHPLKCVVAGTPVYNLIRYGMSAICAHTNFDMAVEGVTDLMRQLLDLEKGEVLDPIHADGSGYGLICTMKFAISAQSLAEICKKAFDCESIRFNDAGLPIKRVALSSGAGNSEIEIAKKKNCDALITGDIKWSSFVDAQNMGLTVIDAGHFYTENILCSHLVSLLGQKFPEAEIFIPYSNSDLCKYV